MTCSTDNDLEVRLATRIHGDLRDTRIVITDDDVTIDPSAYTWLAEGAPAGSTVKSWSMSSITTSGADIIIAWTNNDLGSCAPGDWWVELTGTQGGKARPKVRLVVTIEAEIS
jgi:hypothetical protein